MGRLRRGGIALCAAFVMAATGLIGVASSPSVPVSGGSPTEGSTEPTTSKSGEPLVVPGRYLVQTADRARLVRRARQVGATVNATYDSLWSGVSLTATDAQLAQLEADGGVEAVFPVYRLHLADPATDTVHPDEVSTSDTDPVPGEGTLTETAEPTARDDTVAVDYRVPTALPVLDNDSPATAEVPLDPTSVILLGEGASPDGKHLTVENKADLAVNPDGSVTVTSLPGWSGTLDPITYRVSDTDQATATAHLMITVNRPAAPTAADDQAEGTTGRRISTDVLANDTAGGRAALQAGTLQLASGTDTWDTTVVDDHGTWTVSGGMVDFDPADGFVGIATIDYRIADEFGQTASATVRVTCDAAPTASDHTATTAYLTPVTLNLLDDVQDGQAAAIDPASLVLRNADAELVRHLSVEGEGSYQVNDDGSVSFDPARGFSGASTPIDFQFSDVNGATAGARLQVTVTAPDAPTAVADSARVLPGAAIPIDVLANDEAGAGASLQPGSLCLRVDTGCVATAEDPLGTWQVSGGRVGFTANQDASGTAEIAYQVSDELGQVATATITVTVHTAANAADDHAHTAYRVPVTVDVLANDTPGNSAGSPGSFDPASLLFTGSGEALLTTSAGEFRASAADGSITFSPAQGQQGRAQAEYEVTDSFGETVHATLTVDVGAAPVAVADTATTKQHVAATIDPLANDTPGDDGADQPGTFDPASVTITATDPSDAGTWTVNAGQVTFAPGRTFTGSAHADYRATDSFGNPATATITVTVEKVTPIAADDHGHAPARHPVTVDVLANDAAGDASAPVDPTTLVLTDSAATGNDHTLTTTEGTWTIDTGAHTVTFTPADGFSGPTHTGYQVSDANGTPATATITATIGAPSTAVDYTAPTKQNVTVDLALADILSLGDNGGEGDEYVKASLDCATAAFTAADATDDGHTLVVQGVGRWELDENCQVMFDPESAFTGSTGTAYTVTDSFGNSTGATITVTVAEINPRNDGTDEAHTAANNPVTIDVLAGWSAGDESAPLRPESLEILDDSPTSGIWTITGDHRISFTPAKDFSGTATAFYQLADNNGTRGTAKLTVQVGALPTAAADAQTVNQDGSVLTLTPLANDHPGDDGAGAPGTFVASSVALGDAGTAQGTDLGPGTYRWSVAGDGTVSFAPDWRFVGTASTTYRATDSFGNAVTSTLTVVVTPSPQTATEKRLSAIGALDSGEDGSGIKVGVIDSGINYDHPDLGGTSTTAFPTSRVTTGWDYVGNDASPMDCFGHGTHVAGILGANGNPKLDGAFGVAPKVTFGAYRVFDCDGEGTTDNVLAAMVQAGKDGMNVVNLSLGATAVSWPNETAYPLTQAAANLVKQGVVVVAAAGNSDKGLFTVGSPAVAPGVISVAATDSTGTAIAPYSAIGLAADLSLSPTIAAPGSDVYSTVLGSDHGTKSGTSMAAPEVAGAVAAILQTKGWKVTPGTPEKVAALLYGTASPLDSTTSGVTGRPEAVFRQGAGLMQLQSALAATVTASPSTLNLGEGSSDTRTIRLSNTGPGAVTYKVSVITSTSAAASTGSGTDAGNQTPSWAYGGLGFSASPASVTVPAGGTATVKVKITAPKSILKGRQGMLYGGWVRFTASDTPTVSVPFAGLRGDYQKVRLLPRSYRSFTDTGSGIGYTVKLPSLAYITSSGAVQPTTSSSRTFHVAQSNGQPMVMFHLDYPTSAIRLRAINQKTRKSYWAVLSGTSTQLGKRGRDESYLLVSFYGIYKKSGGKLARVPKGKYKLQLRVLKPLGSSKKKSNWETYTTHTLKVSWT